MTRIRELLASERPRERLWASGATGLKTSELIAILLRTGLQGKSAIALGEELLHRYASLDSLCKASAQELSKIKGIGPTKAVQLKAAFELGARLSASRRLEQPIETPLHVQELLGNEMRLLPNESLRVIALNAMLKLIAVEEISKGTVNETIAHPRDIFRAALSHNAHGIIVVHNHPSGDPRPSMADVQFTQDLKRGSEMLQIELLDHIILGVASADQPDGYYSFKEGNYL